MGHYDRDYEDTERRITNERIARQMIGKRKVIDKVDELLKYTEWCDSHACDIPDRFKWAMEDYRNWLNVGLDDWERNHIVDILKAK